jgi:hypothetical protein
MMMLDANTTEAYRADSKNGEKCRREVTADARLIANLKRTRVELIASDGGVLAYIDPAKE